MTPCRVVLVTTACWGDRDTTSSRVGRGTTPWRGARATMTYLGEVVRTSSLAGPVPTGSPAQAVEIDSSGVKVLTSSAEMTVPMCCSAVLEGTTCSAPTAPTSSTVATGSMVPISTARRARCKWILTAGTATGYGNHTLVGIEEVDGSQYDDTLIGSPGSDVFAGYEGNDMIDGAGGIDRVSFLYSEGGIHANLTTGVATGEGTDTLIRIEEIEGSQLNDELVGDTGPNRLLGSYGADRPLRPRRRRRPERRPATRHR